MAETGVGVATSTTVGAVGAAAIDDARHFGVVDADDVEFPELADTGVV